MQNQKLIVSTNQSRALLSIAHRGICKRIIKYIINKASNSNHARLENQNNAAVPQLESSCPAFIPLIVPVSFKMSDIQLRQPINEQYG